MASDELIELARAVSFARRDGRLACEAGQPISANPHALPPGGVAACVARTGDETTAKVCAAWIAGWQTAAKHRSTRCTSAS
jgi:hypothetical protein